ncbi:MAG: hypothetical protein ACI4CT_04315 [Lachnospiraceae bacterium]
METKQSSGKERKSKRPQKGSYGYMDWYKKKITLQSLIWVAIVAALSVSGKWLGGMPGAVLLVLGVLAVLPATRVWVGWILVFRYHTASKEELQEAEQIADTLVNKVVLYDLVISSADKVRYVPICIITNGKIHDTIELMRRIAKEKINDNQQLNEQVAHNLLLDCI